VKLLEALRGLIDGIFGPLNALFRTKTSAPLSLDDPAFMLHKTTVLDMGGLEDCSRTSEAVVRASEVLTKAASEGGKLEDQVRCQSEIERGI
jgi:hypothetical protein